MTDDGGPSPRDPDTVSSRVLLLDAGGTIAQVWDPGDATFKYMDDGVPFGWLNNVERSALAAIAQVDYAAAEGCPGDSDLRRPTDWGRVARQLFDARNGYDAFVISHGTVTLAYGASMLSYMLADLRKPIIYTGAQIPIRGAPGAMTSDGMANLIASVEVAARGIVRGVAIVFGRSVLQGNRSYKASAFGRDPYRSPNCPPLARVDALGVTYYPQPGRPSPPPLLSSRRFLCDDSVQVVTVHPALRPESLRLDDHAPAVLVGGYLAGIIPKPLRQEILSFARERLVVVYATTELGPAIELSELRASVPFLSDDVVSARDMTFEAALTKTCWVLAQTTNLDQQRKMLSLNIAGELVDD